MQDIFNKLLNGIWSVWRFRWTALLSAWLVAAAGWIVVYEMEHKYYATARIYVDTNQVLEPLLSGLAIQPDVKMRVALMGQTLLSRPNLEQLVEETNLSLEFKAAEDKELVLDKLHKNLSVFDASGSRSLYSVGYAHGDPTTAKQVVQALIDIFIDSNLGDASEDNVAARQFLDDRIDEYEVRLVEAEKRLSDFKRENAGSMPGESGGYYQRTQQAEAQLRTASLTLREAQNRRNELQRQLDSEQPLLMNQDPNWVPPEVARIQDLQQQLDELLVRYTDRHPRVAQLRKTISDLQLARERSVADQANTDGKTEGTTSVPSPIHQQVRTMLAESEARVAELQVRASQYQSELDALKGTIDSIPQVEAQLVQLNRDYETVRAQHSILLERRESQRLTEAVKKNSDNVKFRVVDPPFVPSKPSVPNKKLLNAGVMGVSVLFGICLSVLLALLMPVFYDRQSLAVTTGTQVLGQVSLHQSSGARMKHWIGVMVFLSLTAALFGIAAGLVMLDYRRIDLDLLMLKYPVPFLNDIIQSDVYQAIIESSIFKKLDSLITSIL